MEYFIVQSSEYKDELDIAKETKMKDEAVDKLLACLFINRSDQSKYGSLIKKLQSQYALGTE